MFQPQIRRKFTINPPKKEGNEKDRISLNRMVENPNSDKICPICSIGGDISMEALNKSSSKKTSFLGKRLEYMGFFRKNNLKSEVP